jgi:hypothetical protein
MADADRTFARSALIQGLHRAAAKTALARGKSGIVNLTEHQIRDLMAVVGGFSDQAYKVQWATEPRDRATHSMRSALACAAAMHALFYGGQEEFDVSAEWAGKMVEGEYVNGTSRHMITNTDAFTVAFNLHVETSEIQHYHVSRHSTPLKENGAGRQGGMLTQSIKCIPIASAGGDYGRSVWVWQLKEGEQPPVGAVQQQGAVDGVWMLPLVGMRTATIEQEDDIFLIYRHDVPPQVVYESHRVVLDSFIDALRSKYFNWAKGDTVTREMRAGTVSGLKTGITRVTYIYRCPLTHTHTYARLFSTLPAVHMFDGEAIGLQAVEKYIEADPERYLRRKIAYLKYSAACSSIQQLLDVGPMFRSFKKALAAAIKARKDERARRRAKEASGPVLVSSGSLFSTIASLSTPVCLRLHVCCELRQQQQHLSPPRCAAPVLGEM